MSILDEIEYLRNDFQKNSYWEVYVKHDLALYLLETGDIKQAEPLLRGLAFDNHIDNLKGNYQFVARENLCDLLILKGWIREAESLAGDIVQAYEADDIVGEWGWKRS